MTHSFIDEYTGGEVCEQSVVCFVLFTTQLPLRPVSSKRLRRARSLFVLDTYTTKIRFSVLRFPGRRRQTLVERTFDVESNSGVGPVHLRFSNMVAKALPRSRFSPPFFHHNELFQFKRWTRSFGHAPSHQASPAAVTSGAAVADQDGASSNFHL